jgi:glucose-6-phosphate-specific signal transduction histidine kinase
MRDFSEHVDGGSLVVIVLTLALFGIALVVKGFTHDILLEAGVFLVSVKLILMAYKIGKQEAAVQAKLDQVLAVVEKLERTASRAGAGGVEREA